MSLVQTSVTASTYNLFNHAKKPSKEFIFFTLWHMYTTYPYFIMPHFKRDHIRNINK